ncbi:MAG: methyl-accepting chemotaxis protein [Proteobacteria bacterium]|nr:methyl-accepting chemotaxis protein [Pseudomonadota bacterium]
MRFILKLVFSNIFVAVFALFLAFFRQVSQPNAEVMPVNLTVWSIMILLAFLVIFLTFIFTAGIKMVKNTAEFMILYEKDPDKLKDFDPGKQARVGVEILNWPYSAAFIAGILGLIGSAGGLIIPSVMGFTNLSLSLYASLAIDYLVVTLMTAVLIFFFNTHFATQMLARLDEAGFPRPDYHDSAIRRLGIRSKFSFTIIFIIFLVLYFFSTDVLRRLDWLATQGKIPDEILKPVSVGVLESTLLVGIYATIMILLSTRALTNSISRLDQGVRKISKGSLEWNPLLQPSSADEIGAITDAVDRMRSTLSQKLEQITEQASRLEAILFTIREIIPLLASLTEEMMRISHKQEAGAAQQFESIRGVQAGVEDLSVVAREITEGSTQVMERAEAALREGEEGTTTIDFFKRSIENFAERATEVGERIQTLTLVGDEVERILKLIEGIANKSDVLALNAALEGAKAGEAGKGFMLIADNMRRLAELIVKEADQIRPILRQIETSTREIMGAIDSNLAETRIGSELMVQAHGSFKNIYQSVQKANDTVYGILQGTRQQETLTQKIIEHATRVAEIAREGSALGKVSTQTAERLVEISNRLKSLLASGAQPGPGVPGK